MNIGTFFSVIIHRRTTYFLDGSPSLVELYAKQFFSPDFDRAGGKEATVTSNVVLKEMAALVSIRTVETSTVPPGLVPIRKFQVHVVRSLGNMYRGVTFFKNTGEYHYRYGLTSCADVSTA